MWIYKHAVYSRICMEYLRLSSVQLTDGFQLAAWFMMSKLPRGTKADQRHHTSLLTFSIICWKKNGARYRDYIASLNPTSQNTVDITFMK